MLNSSKSMLINYGNQQDKLTIGHKMSRSLVKQAIGYCMFTSGYDGYGIDIYNLGVMATITIIAILISFSIILSNWRVNLIHVTLNSTGLIYAYTRMDLSAMIQRRSLSLGESRKRKNGTKLLDSHSSANHTDSGVWFS